MGKILIDNDNLILDWEGKWCATSFTGSSGFDSHPEIFHIIFHIKNFEGGFSVSLYT